MAASTCKEQGNSARPCIKVIDQFVTLEFSKIPYNTVKTVSLTGIGLIERLGAYTETEPSISSSMYSLPFHVFTSRSPIVSFTLVLTTY